MAFRRRTPRLSADTVARLLVNSALLVGIATVVASTLTHLR
ncbi:MAG TPA: hypothetical protein VLA00_14780 [Xanthobacteraceae bacterium]|nr:hypothetical protein [Xanthobacteraceae bacterium]